MKVHILRDALHFMNVIMWLLYVFDCFISVYLIIQVCVLTKNKRLHHTNALSI